MLKTQLYHFLETVNREGYTIPEEILTKFSQSTKRSLQRQFRKRNSPFHLYMSNVGRPLCQLQMERDGVEGEIPPSHNILRNLHGEIIEDIVVFLLRAAGIMVVAEQLEVSLEIAGTTLNGRLDVILEVDGEQSVWDIKSASAWSFANKSTFEELVKNDIFGYIPQLILYAKAAKVRAGGWITLDKSTGQIEITEIPRETTTITESTMRMVSTHIMELSSPFRRGFDLEEELIKGKPSGKRKLSATCAQCRYKYPCWPEIKPVVKGNKIVYYV